MLSTKVSTICLRLRLVVQRCLRPFLRGVVDAGFNSWRAPRLTCGSMLEVSRDAVAAGEEQIFSSAAGQSKYCSICLVTLNPCGVYLSRVGVVAVYSRRRWRFERLFCRLRLRKRISVWGPAGGIPSQPNEAMARIASRRNGTISLDPSCRVKITEKGSLVVDSKLFSKVQMDSKGLG